MKVLPLPPLRRLFCRLSLCVPLAAVAATVPDAPDTAAAGPPTCKQGKATQGRRGCMKKEAAPEGAAKEAAPKKPPRRAVPQTPAPPTVSQPPPPEYRPVLPPSAPRVAPGPIVTPPPAQAGPGMPAPVTNCDAGGCVNPDGGRYNGGTGNTYLNNGRLCQRNGVWMQCF